MHTSYTYARILYKGVIILAGCVGAGKGVGGGGGGGGEESFIPSTEWLRCDAALQAGGGGNGGKQKKFPDDQIKWDKRDCQKKRVFKVDILSNR